MTYDPSNFVQCGVKNYPDAFNLLRPYIHMHIKDSVATGRKAQRDTGFDTITDAHRPAGYGDGDLKRIVTALYEDGYEGFSPSSRTCRTTTPSPAPARTNSPWPSRPSRT